MLGVPQVRTIIVDPAAAPAPDLVGRDFTATRPDDNLVGASQAGRMTNVSGHGVSVRKAPSSAGRRSGVTGGVFAPTVDPGPGSEWALRFSSILPARSPARWVWRRACGLLVAPCATDRCRR